MAEWYRETFNIRDTKSQNVNVSRLVLQLSLPNPLKPEVENEDVVGAAPTGDAPTTSEWSKIVLPTKVRLKLEVWRYVSFRHFRQKRPSAYFMGYTVYFLKRWQHLLIHQTCLPILHRVTSQSLGQYFCGNRNCPSGSEMTVNHSTDVTWASWRLKSPATTVFVHQLQDGNIGSIRASH